MLDVTSSMTDEWSINGVVVIWILIKFAAI